MLIAPHSDPLPEGHLLQHLGEHYGPGCHKSIHNPWVLSAVTVNTNSLPQLRWRSKPLALLCKKPKCHTHTQRSSPDSEWKPLGTQEPQICSHCYFSLIPPFSFPPCACFCISQLPSFKRCTKCQASAHTYQEVWSIKDSGSSICKPSWTTVAITANHPCFQCSQYK